MIKIRAFNKSDRPRIRQICCDVADRGEPIESFFPDREFAADLLTKYYTDYEPENSFVAESDGLVVGYINSALDNRRYGLVIIFIIIPFILIKGIVRGVFIRPEFLQILKASLKNWRRLFVLRKTSFGSHQGHLHIGILKEFRHQHIGEKLVQVLLDHAKNTEVTEIVASVSDQNPAACRFFERLGFIVLSRYPMMMADGPTIKEYHSISYVKKIR